jgi:hypothetical protein
MKNASTLCSLVAILLTAGCKTTEPGVVTPVAWEGRQAYMAKVKDPRYYGYSIYQTPAGIEYRGGCRLHPNQAKIMPMVECDPQRPVVTMTGRVDKDAPLLLDFCQGLSWMEFNLAQSVRAVPISEKQAMLVTISGEEIPGCLSVAPTLRIDQIFIENPQVIVRLANGPLGSLARGMVLPEPKGVVGWDILKRFEQIQLDYAAKKVALVTAETEYQPDPSGVAAALPLVSRAKGCAVNGEVNGEQKLILIDPAGDFEVATDGGTPVQQLRLGERLEFSSPVTAVSPGGTRIGARLLQKFKVTVCPKRGLIVFENAVVEGK